MFAMVPFLITYSNFHLSEAWCSAPMDGRWHVGIVSGDWRCRLSWERYPVLGMYIVLFQCYSLTNITLPSLMSRLSRYFIILGRVDVL